MHFSRTTSREYVDELCRKICKAHKKLPKGDFLVFLTSQSEIYDLSSRLKENLLSIHSKHTQSLPNVKIQANEGDLIDTISSFLYTDIPIAPVEAEDIDFGISHQHNEDLTTDLSDSDDDNSDPEDSLSIHTSNTPGSVQILPLYSLLPTSEQVKVFEPVPSGSRRIVLATNIAETSLTIPGITYVFDSGRAKVRTYNASSGVQSYEIVWISKASAQQRAGRAGRTAAGHCYRLYSSAVYERDFEEFDQAEITRTPIEGVVLQLKSMGIKNIPKFPFPSSPGPERLTGAEHLLSSLGAIDHGGLITSLGNTMCLFPVAPRFAKILAIGHQHQCMPYVIAIIAALSVGEIFISESQLSAKETDTEDNRSPDRTSESVRANTQKDKRSQAQKERRRRHFQFTALDKTSDGLKLLAAICAFDFATKKSDFAQTNFLRFKALQDTLLLRRQLWDIVRTNCPGVLGRFEERLSPPTTLQVQALRQIMAAGFVDQVAIRGDLHPDPPSNLVISKGSSRLMPYLPLVPLPKSFDADGSHSSGSVFIHPSSVLATSQLPEYVVYTHLQQASAKTADGLSRPKTRMIPLTPVTSKELASLAKGTNLLSYSKPISTQPVKQLSSTRRECWVIPMLGEAVARGGFGWPLPARKVIQSQGTRGVWTVE
jgi:ATP-dependent RNA helicase DHX37/DHR1